MEILLYLAAAVTAYLVSGWNPAITFSKHIYHKDIRLCGSGNAGFTNFRRTFGDRWAWWVLLFDLTKAAAVTLLFANLSENYAYCAAFTGIFALLGHSFPVWYNFRGGKGFLVTLSVMCVIDWRVGLAATVTMVILLLTTKYMSVSTVTALLVCPILMFILHTDIPVILMSAGMVLFVALRHRENFKRLRAGTESKFSLKSGKKKS